MILGIYFEVSEMKLALFCQIHWLILIFKSDQNLSIITAWQPWIMVAKDIFPFATMTDGCKKVNFIELFWKILRSGVQNAIFMGNSHEISIFATVRHGCKGKNILCNHDSWLQRIFFALQPWLTVAKRQILWDFPIIFIKMRWLPKTCIYLWFWQNSEFNFSFFKVDFQNPKVSLEYLSGYPK